MIFTSCTNCGKVKFMDQEGKIFWVELMAEENLALEIICKSESLLAMVDGFEEDDELCQECIILVCN